MASAVVTFKPSSAEDSAQGELPGGEKQKLGHRRIDEQGEVIYKKGTIQYQTGRLLKVDLHGAPEGALERRSVRIYFLRVFRRPIHYKEAEFLQTLLPVYYMNLNQNHRTLLPKYFGLFCYQSLGKNIRVLVMNNLLPQAVTMHEKCDIKGSTFKRMASKAERAKAHPTLKDLDFLENRREGIMIDPANYEFLIKTISRDCLVLESFKIMDYSLLVGIHNLELAGVRLQKMESEDDEGRRSPERAPNTNSYARRSPPSILTSFTRAVSSPET